MLADSKLDAQRPPLPVAPVVAIVPQYDQFTFDIARALHKKLSERTNSGFRLADQRRVEDFVIRPCICDGYFPEYPQVLHNDTLPLVTRDYAGGIAGANAYFALVVTNDSGARMIGVRFGQARILSRELSLGRIRHANTKQTVRDLLKLIDSNIELAYSIAAARSNPPPPYFAVLPQVDEQSMNVAQIVHDILSKNKAPGVFVVPQERIENVLRDATNRDSVLRRQFPRHTEEWNDRMFRSMAIGLRSTAYVTLTSTAADDFATIAVRFALSSSDVETRLLATVPYTRDADTAKRIATIIEADADYKRVVSSAVRQK